MVPKVASAGWMSLRLHLRAAAEKVRLEPGVLSGIERGKYLFKSNEDFEIIYQRLGEKR